jgi:hypothetical protein
MPPVTITGIMDMITSGMRIETAIVITMTELVLSRQIGSSRHNHLSLGADSYMLTIAVAIMKA